MRLEPSSQNGVNLENLIACDVEYNGFASSQDEGERMADVLGDKKILLLANHGAVTTGDTVAEAYYRLYFLERAAMTQMIAMAAGKRRMISEVVQSKMRPLPGALRNDVDLAIVMYFNAMKRVLNAEGSDYAT